MTTEKSNYIKSFFLNISGIQYALIYATFNYFILRGLIPFLPLNIFVIGGFGILCSTIPLIAAYFRIKKLKFPLAMFILLALFTFFAVFYGYDFQNEEMTENLDKMYEQGKEVQVLLIYVSGMLQLFFILPVNLTLICKDAVKKKVKKTQLSKEELEKIGNDNTKKMLKYFVGAVIVIIIIGLIQYFLSK